MPWYQQRGKVEARTWLPLPPAVWSLISHFISLRFSFPIVSEPGYFSKSLPALPLYGSVDSDQENTMLESENLGLYIRFINSIYQNGSSSCRYTVGLYFPLPR